MSRQKDGTWLNTASLIYNLLLNIEAEHIQSQAERYHNKDHSSVGESGCRLCAWMLLAPARSLGLALQAWIYQQAVRWSNFSYFSPPTPLSLLSRDFSRPPDRVATRCFFYRCSPLWPSCHCLAVDTPLFLGLPLRPLFFHLFKVSAALDPALLSIKSSWSRSLCVPLCPTQCLLIPLPRPCYLSLCLEDGREGCHGYLPFKTLMGTLRVCLPSLGVAWALRFSSVDSRSLEGSLTTESPSDGEILQGTHTHTHINNRSPRTH